MKLFEPQKLGSLTLKNRIVMAPMTRSRAIENIPNDLMATYYAQRVTRPVAATKSVPYRAEVSDRNSAQNNRDLDIYLSFKTI